MRKALLLSVIFVLGLPLFAQQPAAQAAAANNGPGQALAPDAPSREELLKLFDMLEIKKQMDSIRDSMSKSLEQQFSQMTRGQLTAKQVDELGKLESELFGKMMSDDFVSNMMDVLIPIYQRHFTSSDVSALIAFYSTVVGQKFLHEQAQIMAEYMPKAMENMQGRVQKVMDETHFTERVEQIMAEGESKQPAKK
ncbi:MAG TPA: DUF2059 domain-containing protein [Candidatus Solibacter sp.]|jgi:hypothetical protein|nr:DUF2059 domain-containing protein [Candidatus Solibacter sp.]